MRNGLRNDPQHEAGQPPSPHVFGPTPNMLTPARFRYEAGKLPFKVPLAWATHV